MTTWAPMLRASRETIGSVAAGSPKNGTKDRVLVAVVHIGQVIKGQVPRASRAAPCADRIRAAR
jgi:hypothetical protein